MTTAQTPIDRLSFEKIFQFPQHLRNLVENVDDHPIHMQVGPVNFCNHNCTFCDAARSMFDAKAVPRTRINVERLMEIIEEMRELGLRAVTLTGSGEPTLHPDLDRIVRGIHERGIDVALFTNGSCMPEKTLDALLEHAAFVRFSLTGASSKIHDVVHESYDFERVITNIARIVEKRRGDRPTLGSQFVLASYSAEEAVAGARLAKSLGLDYYELKPAYASPDKADQMANTLSIAEASLIMEEAKTVESEDFQVYAKMEQMESVFGNMDDRDYDDCPGHKTTTILEADFSLYICTNQKVPEFCFGNLRSDSFGDVWSSPRRREILRNLNVHHCIPRCRMDPLNKIVHEIRIGTRMIPLDPPTLCEQVHPNFL